MPLPTVVVAIAKTGSGGGASLSGKIAHVEDMTPAYLSDAKTIVEKAILACGFIVQRETKLLLNKNKGRTVTRNRATGRFQKSAVSRSKPGEVPFFQTGKLSKWISVEGARTGWGEFFAKVGPAPPTDVYGMALEFGSPKNNLAPRPYLRPAFDNKKKEIEEIIGNAVSAVSGGGKFRDPSTGRFMSGGS
jgi:hypothetical protein